MMCAALLAKACLSQSLRTESLSEMMLENLLLEKKIEVGRDSTRADSALSTINSLLPSKGLTTSPAHGKVPLCLLPAASESRLFPPIA